MIVRALDSNHDWSFGAGLNNYKRNQLAVIQSIQTRLLSFVGNCFFDMGAGINWFTFLGSKGANNNLQLIQAISVVILNTPSVQGLLQLSFDLSSSRVFSITYQVQTSYSVVGNTFQYDLGGGG